MYPERNGSSQWILVNMRRYFHVWLDPWSPHPPSPLSPWSTLSLGLPSARSAFQDRPVVLERRPPPGRNCVWSGDFSVAADPISRRPDIDISIFAGNFWEAIEPVPAPERPDNARPRMPISSPVMSFEDNVKTIIPLYYRPWEWKRERERDREFEFLSLRDSPDFRLRCDLLCEGSFFFFSIIFFLWDW